MFGCDGTLRLHESSQSKQHETKKGGAVQVLVMPAERGGAPRYPNARLRPNKERGTMLNKGVGPAAFACVVKPPRLFCPTQPAGVAKGLGSKRTLRVGFCQTTRRQLKVKANLSPFG